MLLNPLTKTPVDSRTFWSPPITKANKQQEAKKNKQKDRCPLSSRKLRLTPRLKGCRALIPSQLSDRELEGRVRSASLLVLSTPSPQGERCAVCSNPLPFHSCIWNWMWKCRLRLGQKEGGEMDDFTQGTNTPCCPRSCAPDTSFSSNDYLLSFLFYFSTSVDRCRGLEVGRSQSGWSSRVCSAIR